MEHEGSTGAKLAPANANASNREALAGEWRRLSRAATFVAILTSPGFMAVLRRTIFRDNPLLE